MVFYRFLADVVVVAHVAFIGFVLTAMLLILVGMWFRWSWVRNFWFRIIHFAMIALVVGQSLARVTCPLTTLEKYFRVRSGESTYPGSFIGHWADQLIFYHGPEWVFTTCYTLFGAAVLLALALCPPRLPRRRKRDTQLMS
jgi:multisubunit Na+/H+ antiporter MnhB subunit